MGIIKKFSLWLEKFIQSIPVSDGGDPNRCRCGEIHETKCSECGSTEIEYLGMDTDGITYFIDMYQCEKCEHEWSS